MKIYNYSNIVATNEIETFFKTFKYLDTDNLKLFIMPKNKILSIILEYLLILFHFYQRAPSIKNHNSYNAYISYNEINKKKIPTYICIYTYTLTSKINCINKVNFLTTFVHELRHSIQFKKNMFKNRHIEKHSFGPSKEYRNQEDEIDAELYAKQFLNKNKILISKLFNIKYNFFIKYNKSEIYNEIFFKNN